ncbi:MAG TPA: DinB family protein [Actinomycetota bacterium]|nr:DinB family protein [Actinomycetota bacterium]
MPNTPLERTAPPFVADEHEMLGAWLDSQRDTVVWKIQGLDDEQLRRVMTPSGLTLLGLVKHLTAVEHGWFAVNFAATGEPHLFESPDDPDLDFHVQPGDTTEQVVEGYARACARSREIYSGATSLDATFEHPRRGTMSLRWLMIHMIEETARHAGHADIMRELIDGATGY